MRFGMPRRKWWRLKMLEPNSRRSWWWKRTVGSGITKWQRPSELRNIHPCCMIKWWKALQLCKPINRRRRQTTCRQSCSSRPTFSKLYSRTRELNVEISASCRPSRSHHFPVQCSSSSVSSFPVCLMHFVFLFPVGSWLRFSIFTFGLGHLLKCFFLLH